jgi:SNF2 family DNA or RNA helicase
MTTDLTIQRWIIAADGIVSTSNGNKELLPARRIWEAVYSPASSDSNHVAPLIAGGLRFSRFPAESALIVRGSVLSGITSEIAVLCDGRERTLHSLESDQVIESGCWYPVDRGSLNQLLETLDGRGIKPGLPLRIRDLVWLHSSDNLDVKILDRTQSVPAAELGISVPTEAVPGLEASLYAYQQSGVGFLRLVAAQGLGCILGDEMGLGKTLQVIGLFQSQKNAGYGPFLVICPATLLENWRREITQFAPSLHVLIHAGEKRCGAVSGLRGYDVVVTSYETAMRDEPFLTSVAWNTLALDEAQNIKNPSAQRTLCVKRFPRDVSIAVTGTPVENRLTDLWSLADFALPGLLGSVHDFESEYDDTHEDASRLAPFAAPILLRRRVSEVATDLPPRIDIPQAIEMPRSMAEMYEAIRKETLIEYPKSGALVALTRLRMFSAHPALIMPWDTDPAAGMPKFARLVELLEEIFSVGEKTLVFSTYKKVADIAIKNLRRRFSHAFVDFIDGRVPVSERQQIVDRFTAHKGYGVLVLNPKAAGTGLNITAANHVIHYNPEWNPAVEDQASARAYRRKQTRPVTVHHLFFANTVEEVMVDRLHFKRGLAEGAATGHQGEMDAADILRALAVSPIGAN